MYFLIIPLGFLLAMRGAKPAPLQDPAKGLACVWREAADLLLTTGLTLTLWAAAVALDKTQILAREYAILGLGAVAYLLARYQKKNDVFFLACAGIVFWISLRQNDLFHGLSLAWAVSLGIALFQTCFLGLRYKLLFSDVPDSMKGWPILCLLAAFISMALGSLGDLIF